MLEDFIKKDDVDDKTFRKEVVNMVGSTAGGNPNKITISVKVNRGLYGKYDILRRVFRRTKVEDFEYFMRWSIEKYRSESRGLDEFLTEEGKDYHKRSQNMKDKEKV